MRKCFNCGATLHHGLVCACHFPRYTCALCPTVGASRTIPDDRAAAAAFHTHYMRHHYKETQ